MTNSEDSTETFHEALERAKLIERPEWIPWPEVPELEDHDDPDPELPGTDSLEKAIRSHRCGHPLKSVWKEHGKVRFCTRLPMSRMGRGDGHSERFCWFHRDSEPDAMKPSELFGEWARTIVTEEHAEDLRERLDYTLES